MGNLVSCVHCNYEEASRSATSCPNCGRDRFNRELYVTCITCGRGVYQGDKACGACGETDFKGETCRVCKGRIRRRDAVLGWVDGPWYPDEPGTTIWYCYHLACIQRYFVLPGRVPCRDCGHQLPPLNALNLAKGDIRRLPPCLRCGCPSPYARILSGRCCSCGLPVYTFQDKRHRKSQRKTRAQFQNTSHDSCGSWRPPNRSLLADLLSWLGRGSS